MYSFVARLQETSAIKPEESYTYFKYTGKPVKLSFRGTKYSLETGDKFGVRPSADRKNIRLILPDIGGVSRVFTLSETEARKLGKNCKAVKK